MNETFKPFLDNYLDSWKSSSLSDLKKMISKDYQAREITRGEIEDFGYDQSIKGWEQGFQFVKESGAEWELTVTSVMPLRGDEIIVVILAAMNMDGENYENGNLFFQTFKLEQDWKLIRSYIEAGVPLKTVLGG